MIHGKRKEKRIPFAGIDVYKRQEEYRFEERNHSEEALKIFINNLCPVVSYAEKMGVIVAIEPVYKHIVCNPKRCV